MDEVTSHLRQFLVSLLYLFSYDGRGEKTVMSGLSFPAGKARRIPFLPPLSVSCFYFLDSPLTGCGERELLLHTYDFFTGECFS